MNKWKPAKLGDIAEMCLGKMLDKEKNKGVLQPYIANVNLRWGGFDLTNLSTMRFEESESERYGLKSGDLVVCEGGEPGRCAIWRGENPEMKIQKAIHRVRTNKNYSNEFLFYRFLLAGRNGELKKHFIGSTIKHLTGSSLKQVEFDFPSLTEQNRIASALTALDAKIELNQRINAELEGMAKLLYDYWFVQFDFPMTAAQAAALGKPHLTGHPYRASGGKMIYNETLKRDIPVGWEGGNILAVSDIGGGATPSKKAPEFWGGDVPFFTPTDAKSEPFCLDTEDHLSQLGVKNKATRLYPKGTLFITARGSVGKAMIISKEMAMNQSCYALCPHEGVSSAFLYFHTLSLMNHLRAKSSGSVFDSIVTNDLNFTPAVVPKSEQLTAFNQIAEPMFKTILTHQQQNQELTQLRDWLLPMLMNGQVTVG
jgi:type I restriction enzyme S subunit